LTINHSQPQPRGDQGENQTFAAIIESAEAGDPYAQLRLAEYFSQIKEVQGNEYGQIAGSQPASVSAYMWYLLAEKTATPLLGQIEAGKKNMRRTMFPQQVAEAEGRAVAWLSNAKKRSGFADGSAAKASEGPPKRVAAR